MAVVGMPEGNFEGASPNAHLLIGELPAPSQLKRGWSAFTGGSVAPLLGLVVMALIASRVPAVQHMVQDKLDFNITNLTFLDQKGPGGGGGGGGNNRPDPPRKVELPGKEKITVPVSKPKDLEPVEKPKEVPPPVQQLVAPIQAVAAGIQAVPGVIAPMPSGDSSSMGMGTGSGAGGGNGSGIGPGNGSGLGPGNGGGYGGGEYQPGNGVTSPVLIKEVKPNYTGDAMRAKLQGVVEMEAVVQPDGSVGRVHITRSLDGTFGLDQEAIKAVKQWRFRPGTLKGQPVPVLVNVELTFTLR
jgi:periplasmic protein TonB